MNFASQCNLTEAKGFHNRLIVSQSLTETKHKHKPILYFGCVILLYWILCNKSVSGQGNELEKERLIRGKTAVSDLPKKTTTQLIREGSSYTRCQNFLCGFCLLGCKPLSLYKGKFLSLRSYLFCSFLSQYKLFWSPDLQ